MSDEKKYPEFKAKVLLPADTERTYTYRMFDKQGSVHVEPGCEDLDLPGKSAADGLTVGDLESDFFKRQLEAVDAAIYRDLYKVRVHPAPPSLDGLPSPSPRRVPFRVRLARWWGSLRERVGFAIAGYDPTESDEEW